jgi:hypothetical protein
VVQDDLGVSPDVAWHESYYQLTNQLAYLWFMRERCIEAWLAAVHFTRDCFNGGTTKRVFPETAEEWQGPIANVKISRRSDR